MDLHRRIGLGFASFCGLLLAWTIITPENPDHLVNLVIHATLAPAFAFSTMAGVKVGGWVQVAALFFGASLTAMAGDFQPASAVGSVAVLLIYAYGGFKSIRPSVIIPVSIAQFGLTLWAAWVGEYNLTIALGHALAWTSFSLLGVWVIWMIFQAYAKEILELERKITEQNREMLEATKEMLKKGCEDAAERW